MKKKTKMDLSLESRAAREGWNIKPTYFEKLPAKMFALANNPQSKPKIQIDATRTLVSMDQRNISRKFVDNTTNNPLIQQKIQDLMNAELTGSTTTTDKSPEIIEAVPSVLDGGGADPQQVVEPVPEATEK